MKQVIALLWVMLVSLCADAANSFAEPEMVVVEFVDCLNKWLTTNDAKAQFKLKNLVNKDNFRIDDAISAKKFASDTRLSDSQLTLGMFNSYISDLAKHRSVRAEVRNVKWLKKMNIPGNDVVGKDDKLYLVDATVVLTGREKIVAEDVFYIRNNVIVQIISKSGSKVEALELYSKGKYEEAFNLFRKLAFEKYLNFEERFFLMVMEFKKQGCNHLNKVFRDSEAVWLFQHFCSIRCFRPIYSFAGRYHVSGFAIPDVITLCYKPAEYDLIYSYDKKTKKFGFINSRGDLVVPRLYSFVFPYTNGYANVCENSKFGFIDSRGNTVVKCEWDATTPCFQKTTAGLRAFAIKNHKLYMIDECGHILRSYNGEYDSFGTVCTADFAVVVSEKNAKLFYFSDGEPVDDKFYPFKNVHFLPQQSLQQVEVAEEDGTTTILQSKLQW